MSEIARGIVKRKVELFQTYTQHFGAGLVATDSVQYSSVATVGTTAVEVFNELVDPGVDFSLQEIEVGLIAKFTELTGGTTAGSLAFIWQARQESVATTRGYVTITPTYAKAVSSGAAMTATLAGYVPVASIPEAPVRFKLTARALYADGFEGKVTNNSFVKLIGSVIPGA